MAKNKIRINWSVQRYISVKMKREQPCVLLIINFLGHQDNDDGKMKRYLEEEGMCLRESV